MSLTNTSFSTKAKLFPDENSYYMMAQKKKQSRVDALPKQKPGENIREVLKTEDIPNEKQSNGSELLDSINRGKRSSPRFAKTQIFFDSHTDYIPRRTRPFMTENVFSDEKDVYSKFRSSLKKGVYSEENFTRVNEWKPSLRKIDEPQGQQKEQRRVRKEVNRKNDSNLVIVPEAFVGPETIEKNLRKRAQSPGVSEEYKKLAERTLLLPAEREDFLKTANKKNYITHVSHVFDNLQLGSFEDMNSPGGKFRNQQNFLIHDGSTAKNLVSYEFALPYREQVKEKFL